jgi:hypothetical protein
MEQIKSNKWVGLTLLCVMLATLIMVFKPVEAKGASNVNTQIAMNQTSHDKRFSTPVGSSISDSCTAYFKGTLKVDSCRVGEVPLPAATWLFILALVGFVKLSNKRKI